MSEFITPDHLFFDSFLEVAAVKRMVVNIQWKDDERWENIFVKKVRYLDEDLQILTSTGRSFLKSELKQVSMPVDRDDLESISCLCS